MQIETESKVRLLMEGLHGEFTCSLGSKLNQVCEHSYTLNMINMQSKIWFINGWVVEDEIADGVETWFIDARPFVYAIPELEFAAYLHRAHDHVCTAHDDGAVDFEDALKHWRKATL